MKKSDQSVTAQRLSKKIVFINYQKLYEKSILDIESLKNEMEVLRKENSQLKKALSDTLQSDQPRMKTNDKSTETQDLEYQSQASTDFQKAVESSESSNHSVSFSSSLVQYDCPTEKVCMIVDDQDKATQDLFGELISALQNGNIETVKALLDSPKLTQEAVCYVNQEGQTAVMSAGLDSQEHPENLEALLKSAKLTQQAVCFVAQNGDTALIIMARRGFTNSVKALLGSDKLTPEAVGHFNKMGRTALMTAAESGHTEAVKVLLASDKLTQEVVCSVDRYRYTVLVMAAEYGHTEVVKVLLNSDKLTQEAVRLVNQNGDTAFLTAVKKGHTETVKALLTSDKLTQEVVSYVTVDDKTALMIAAECGHTETFIAVLGSDKFTAEVGRYGDVLVEVGQRGHTEMVKALLASDKLTKEAVCFVNEFGETALMASARRGNTDGELVKLLLESDKLTQEAACYVNKEGRSALMIACETATTEVVKVLLDSIKLTQEVVSHVNQDGGTALTIAIEAGINCRYRIEAATLEALLASDKFTEEAAWSVNKDGETALMIGVKKGDSETIKALLESPKHSAESFSNVVSKGKMQKLNFAAIKDAAEANVSLNTRMKECLTTLCQRLETSKIGEHRLRITEWLKLHSKEIRWQEYFPTLIVRTLIKLIDSKTNDQIIDELLTSFDLKKLFPFEKTGFFTSKTQKNYSLKFAKKYCDLIIDEKINSQPMIGRRESDKILAEIDPLLPDYLKIRKSPEEALDIEKHSTDSEEPIRYYN